MIGAVIVGLLVLSAIGSLLWTLPSKADRQRANMRTEAMQSGLSVMTLSVPDTTDRGRIDDKRRLITLYKKRSAEPAAFQPFTLVRTEGEHGYGLPEGWVWEPPSHRLRGAALEQLLMCLQALPDWIDVLSVQSDGLAVSFNERQGAHQVGEVREFLETQLPVFFPAQSR